MHCCGLNIRKAAHNSTLANVGAYDAAMNSLSHLTEQELQAMMRKAANQVEMVNRPDRPHHVDDVERQRIAALPSTERVELRTEAMALINRVRAELRRRNG